ncbi:MAG: hypothetical protein K0B08_03795 [Bacteroidales bacterium]|nr:hypothetical protein [Bacteroidales bacterium]
MNWQEIEKLLNRYFEGETSLEEENQLREFFSGDQIPEKFSGVAAYFSFMQSEAARFLDKPGFDQQVIAGSPGNKMSKIIKFRQQWYYWASGVAVSIMILVAVFVKFDPFSPRIEDTFQDPQVAYQEAKKILFFVADQLNNGTSRLEPVTRFETGLKSLSPVASYDDGISEISRLNHIDKTSKLISSN